MTVSTAHHTDTVCISTAEQGNGSVTKDTQVGNTSIVVGRQYSVGTR